MAAADKHARARVSVVVATRDRHESLAGTLRALHLAIGPDDEVIVVDSASSGPGTAVIAADHGVRYLRLDVPGVSRARNLGARSAVGDVVAFTDDDCRPRHGWADAFASAFSDGDVGFAAGPVQGLGGGTAADVPDLGDQRWSWPADPAHMGSGASMAVRRSALLVVGGFDERLGPGGPRSGPEEHELFLRLLHGGWTGVFCPGAVVDHDDRRSRWATLRLFYTYGIRAGALAVMARALDPVIARRMLRDRLWSDGVRRVAADVARRWEEPAARAVAMTAGVLVGVVRARGLRSRVPQRRQLPPGSQRATRGAT